jgi:ATP-dependent helicase YprA (DUF1998 family)
MNALATDQARRIAQAVYTESELREGHGGLVHGGRDDQTVEMTPDWVITSKSHGGSIRPTSC